MKTKISHLGRSSVSVILAVMMLLSTMLIGTVSTVNATVNDAIKVYFDKSSCSDNGNTSTDGWTNIYAYAYDNKGDVKTYTNSADVTGKGSWPGQAMYDEGNNIYSILVEPTATSIIFNNNDNSNKKQTGNITLPAEDTLNWKTTSVIYKNNTWVSYSASVDTTGVVTDTRLISVLDGSKVMFYGGEAWNEQYFAAMKTSDKTNVADVAQMKYNKELQSTTDGNTTNITYKFGILCVPEGTYYMGHSSSNTTIGWNSGMSVSVSAGDAFILWNNNNNAITGYTKIKFDSNNNNAIFKSDVSGTTTADTTLSDNEVVTGGSLGVTTSTQAGSSSLGFANTFEYYVHNITTDKFYKVALSDGKIDTSAFDAGEYEVKTVLKDANGLYVLADSDNFVISNKSKYSVTFGSNDENMGKVTVSDGTNSYTTSPASVEEGKSVTFTATANKGYRFDGWYSNAGCTTAIEGATGATYTIAVTDNTTVYAKFVAVDYRVTYPEDTDAFTITDKSATTAHVGNIITFKVSAKTGYEINSVTADSATVTNENGTYTFTMPANNVAITVNASLVQYEITKSGSDELTYKVGDYTVTTATMGQKVTVSATKTGYTLTSISVADENGGAVEVDGLTFTMPARKVTVTPTFTANNHKIAYDGTVTGLESVDVKTSANFGDTVSVTVTAKSGYTVTGITVKETNGDGTVEVTTVADKYQFTMPDYDVTITPVIEVAEIDAPTVNFIGGAGESTANISANQPYPITAEATPAANSQIQSAKAQITSNNASDATLTQTKTGYNFTSNVEGTFTIKYTVVAVSTLDSSKTSTVEKTITITTKFTETQKAYNSLKAYYETVKNPEQSDYSTDAYAALTAKLAEVKTLIDAGLPASSATDTEKYTTAKTELEKAVADKLLNFYIKGRFRIKNSSGSYVIINEGNATSVNENFKFTSQGNGLYSLNTGCTLSELSAAISGSTDYQYFFVYNQENSIRYEPTTSPEKADGKNNATDLNPTTSTTGWSTARFNSSDTSGTVTLWVDASGSTYKFYYTVAVEPKYALAGGFGNPTWDKYDSQYLVKTPVEGKSTVFSEVLVNDTDSNKKFRLVDSSNVPYSVQGGVDLTTYTESNPCTLTKNVSGGGNDLNVPKGKYTLYVDQSGTTPKVWVERIIDTKNVTFSVTGEGTGTVSINGTNVGDTSVQAVEIGSSYTITLTPSADSYVESFKVGDTEVASNTYTGTMPNEDVAVTVVFAKKTIHSVLVESNNGGTAVADIKTAYSGQRVTVTVNADGNHVFDGISVKENTSQDAVDCTKNANGTYTFVMPDDDVNVYAKFREKNTYTVTVVSANQQLGTVALDNSEDTLTKTVKEGDTVTIKATPIDTNSFDTWTLTGNYEFQGCTSKDAVATVVVNSNITATASFTQAAPFKVAYGSNRDFIEMVATRNKGIYISTAAVAFANTENLVGSTPNAQFTIYDSKNSKYAVFNDDKYIWLTSSNPSDTVDRWVTSYTHGVGKGLLNNGYDKVMYVIYNANTQTVTLTDSFDTGDKATLYVKTGTSGTGATGEYASKSEAPNLSATSSGTTYKKYSVDYDTSVNIQTTMSDEYLTARYYVAGYCVNGRSYPASAVDASKGIYQTNITITEDLAENGVVEVTPIYYNRTIEENDNYITFYVDAERLVGGWGSTVAIYAYAYEGGTANYDGNGNVTNNVDLLGAYPGQPMVKDGQYYVAKIPRYSYKISSNGSLEIDTNSPVAGITLNNYYNDAVHNSLVPIKRNMQTYDFSDFVALANKKDVKTIMFQSKFYNATGDAKRNTKVIYGYDTAISDPTKATTQIDNIKSADVNPYEDFTDYYGRATDLIGNILDDNQKDDANNLYVISTGSYNNQSSNYSTKGQWVTIWNVYDHSGNLITYGTPADFLDENTEQYREIAENEQYKGKPVKISYEKGLSYDKGVTSRTDGRWYYSTLGQEFTSDVAIEYKHQNDKDYTADIDSNAGNNTGFVGETTKATATINNVTTASFSSVTETAHLNVKVSNGWRFDGWFIKQGDKYTKVSDNYTDISTDVLMSNSYHIVARISEIPSGTLELNHTAYTGTDPASHSGTGFYYISALLYDQTGALKHSYTETQGKISIDDFAATDSLEITLRAVAHGDNTIYAVYEGIDAGYFEIGEEDYKGDSSFSYTFKVSANSLFKDDKLSVNALNYYTDIVKVGGTCDITYKYYDRFSVEGEGNMVSYVVRNVELSTEEIQDNYQPSDSTITKYAPRIDTMYVDTKWKLDGATNMVDKGKSQATVIATQTNKTCKVYHPVLGDDGYYNTDIKDSTYYTVEFNSLLKDKNGNFLLKTPEYNADKTLKFAYWEVYKVDKNGQSEGEVVTKCYERNFGLRIMADYYIVPVYSENVPNLTANINSPVLNREIYGDSANPTDKLYVDLLTAFTSSDIPTFKENTTNLSVECGVFVVRNNTSTLSVDDRNNLVNAAISNLTDTTSDILKSYKRATATEKFVVDKLEALAVDSSVKDKSNTFDTFDNEQYRITKFIFDNNTLTNKNRIDEVLKYTNNTANQNYIFSAYAFVVIKYSDGRVKEKKISDPQYFNLCYVGNKALDNN